TLPLPSDNRTYVVEVEADGTGCVQSSLPIIVDQNDEVQVNITADICSDPITISVDAGTSWSWTGPNIDGVDDQSSITATPPQGLNVYNLHVEDGVLCPLDTAITVNVDNNVAPALAQSSACDDQVVVTATPSGQFLYRWYRNGAIDNTLAGPQAIATNDGDTYRVEIYNPVTGCTPTSSDLTVSVIGALDLTLESTLACEGNPFTITGTTNVPVGSYQWSYEGSVINGETSPTLEDN